MNFITTKKGEWIFWGYENEKLKLLCEMLDESDGEERIGILEIIKMELNV